MATDPHQGPIVLDANILFAALLREGVTRRLILHGALDLHAPAALWDEFERNRPYLVRKCGISDATFDLLLAALRARIADVPMEAFAPLVADVVRALGPASRLDAPYVACAKALGATLWSHDKELTRRRIVRVVTTADLVGR